MTVTLHPMPPARRESVRDLLTSEARIAAARSRPRSGRRAVLGTAAVMSAVVLAGGSALLLAERRAPAPTGPWSAVPVQAAGPLNLSPDGDEQWGTQCNEITGGAPGFLSVADDPARAANRKILLDVRGGYSFCVDVSYGDGTEADPMVAFAGVRGPAAPESDADADGVRWGGQGAWGSGGNAGDVLAAPGDDDLIMFGEPNHVGPDGQAAHTKVAYGPAGAKVRGVELVLTDGTRITATVANGLWGAWWPRWESTAGVAELLVTSTTGTRSVDPSTVEYRSPDQAY